MQMVSEVMTRNVEFVSPREKLQRAAQMMDQLNVGVLPVCEGDRLVGIITDRDITIRATAAGKSPSEAHVDEVMSTDVQWCFEDQPLHELVIQMADTQIRRVPVISHDDARTLIGIVALGDLLTRVAEEEQEGDLANVVKKVSLPSEPRRPQQTRNASDLREKGFATPEAGGGGGVNTTGCEPAATGTPSARGSTGTVAATGGTDNAIAVGNPAAGDGTSTARGGGPASTDMTDADDSGMMAAGAAGDADLAGTKADGNAKNRSAKGVETSSSPSDATREAGASGGTDAAGVSGASGGTAGAGGSGGTGVGAKP
jgi:CBS domain-containing protein